MVAFALSCFGILVFLWLNFGGSVPLQPEGYRVHGRLPGGHAARPGGGRADLGRARGPREDEGAERRRPASPTPSSRSTRATRRSRRTPAPSCARRRCWARPTWSCRRAPPTAGEVDDGGKLPRGQVADTVELDEILRTFDPETRSAFSTWFDQAGVAAQGNAERAERRARAAHAVRGGHRRGAEGAAPAERRHAALRPRHRLGLRRAHASARASCAT